MAAEAQAEDPTPPPPPPPSPAPAPAAAEVPSPPHDKRAPPHDGAERPEPKRRRACVASLDGVPGAAGAAAAAAEGDSGAAGAGCEGEGEASFTFHHARDFAVALETTPKFGSFNPPAAAELAAFDVKPPRPDNDRRPDEDSPSDEEDPSLRRLQDTGMERAKMGNSDLVGGVDR